MTKNVGRMVLAALLLTCILSGGCSAEKQNTASPAETEQFKPIPAGQSDIATILVPNYYDTATYSRVVTRMNDLLASKGQNVKFSLLACRYDSEGNGNFFTLIKPELAAGKPSADAYALSPAECESLFDSGGTMDVTTLVKDNAQEYCAKYGSLLDSTMKGIPVGIHNRPLWYQAALMLREDFSGAKAPAASVDGLFDFIDHEIIEQKKKETLSCSPDILVSQWALEKSYYQLGLFGMTGHLFMKADDMSYTPVALENIPGFKEFVVRMMEYYKNGSLDASYGTGTGLQAIGYIKYLGDFYFPSPYSWATWISGNYTAQVLSPEMPAVFDDTSYEYELSIPAACSPDKALVIAHFVQWYLSSQENYDSVLYGEPNVDYKAVGSRFTPLTAGTSVDKGISNDELFFTWPGAGIFGSSDWIRLPDSAPSNTEQLVDLGWKSNRRCVALKSLTTDRTLREALKGVDPDIKAIGLARDAAYSNLLYFDFSDTAYDTCMNALAKCRSDLLAKAYQKQLTELGKVR